MWLSCFQACFEGWHSWNECKCTWIYYGEQWHQNFRALWYLHEVFKCVWKDEYPYFCLRYFYEFFISILRLFLAVEEDILSFLRMTSKKMTLVCSEFDKVGTIESALTPLIAVFFLLVIIFRTLIMSHTVHLSAGYCVLQIPTVSKYLHFGDRMHHLVLLSSEII